MVSDVVPISKQLGSNYQLIRVAALSGAAAVCLAAYGRHSMKETAETREFRQIYESANHIHFIHSVALLATPLTKRPLIVKPFIHLQSIHSLSNLYANAWIHFRLEHFSSPECCCSAALAITRQSKSQKVKASRIFHHSWLHTVVCAWFWAG